jgi:glutamyl-tRNA reductase
MNIIALGHNHSTASVEIREKVTFTPERIRSALPALKELNLFQESVILSTCNRNEIYSVVPDFESARRALIEFMYSFHRLQPGTLEGTLYTFCDEEAVEHLFAVASGVDSLIVGETQVFSQVKSAYKLAREMESTGVVLNRLFHRCFETGKKVRHLTGISHGAVSVSYAAAELAKKIFHDLEDKTVLLIGAGETGELAAKHLLRQGASSFIVANRTFEKARVLAAELGGTPAGLDALGEIAEQADVIISATSGADLLLDFDDVDGLMRKRKNSPLFIIDLAVPRDVDPEARNIYNVFLYDMDDLSAIARENKLKREKEIARASKIIAQSTEVFMNWYRSLDATPTIVSLREHFEEVRAKELEKYMKKASPEARPVLEEATRSIINKLLHDPYVQMKKAAENGDGYAFSRAVRRLFRLGEKNG